MVGDLKFSLRWIHNVCLKFYWITPLIQTLWWFFQATVWKVVFKKNSSEVSVPSTDVQLFFCPSQLPPLMATRLETLVVVRRCPWYERLRMRAVAAHPVHPWSDWQQAHLLWSSLFLGWAMFRGLQRPQSLSQLLLYQWRSDTLWPAYY